MERTVYVNGDFCAETEAKVSIFDRGFLFADGVYEVVGVLDGKLLDFPGHMSRLDRSLGEMEIPLPLSHDAILEVHRELVRKNNLRDGMVYMQVTRGCAERDYVYASDMKPGVFLFTQEKPIGENEVVKRGAKLKSVLDVRWARRDIKSIGLLGQVMAKQEAHASGADEALLVDANGMVNEGGSSNAYIIADGTIVTRPLSRDILAGVTRSSLLALAKERGLSLEERAFSLEEAYAAQECFLTAASLLVCPVVEIDGRKIGDGKAGGMSKQLREIYLTHARASAM